MTSRIIPVNVYMQELIQKIKAADIAYYRDANPIMTDREYDELFDELKRAEEATGVILSGSPTQTVAGEILDSLEAVRHTKPMLSANKTKSIEELLRFRNKQPVIFSWKMDGLTIVLRYEDGELKQAITRGREGIIGEDVTHTVKKFQNVPLTVESKEKFEVRGEGVISWENFEKINASLKEPYSHPRNLASGSTRMLDANEAEKRYLEFIAFELICDNLSHKKKSKQLEWLRNQGFDVVQSIVTNSIVDEKVREIIGYFRADRQKYPVDGIIMEFEDVEYGKSLGATGHHENRMMALKWQDELYQTKFLGVELATTRTGMVSITGILEPVMIDGTEVSRAYLHNLDMFESFRFGIGDTVSVYKANMIIPQIAANETKSGTYQLPDTCPCCGEKLIVKSTTGGTRQLFCENPACSSKLVQKFVHFCDKTRMDIEGISDSTIEKFVGFGWLQNFGDLYELERYHDEIVQTEGFGEKSFERLQASIEKSRKRTLAQFIAGLGIPMVGRHAGRDLDSYFDGSWEAFENAIQNNFDFTILPNFGEIMHANIHKWYTDKEAEKLWRPLLEKIEFVKENRTMATNMNNPFVGKTMVATGKFENYTRDSINVKFMELGANPASSVTKKTDYLIVGEKAGSKLTKAEQLGIRTLTEEEFESMLA